MPTSQILRVGNSDRKLSTIVTTQIAPPAVNPINITPRLGRETSNHVVNGCATKSATSMTILSQVIYDSVPIDRTPCSVTKWLIRFLGVTSKAGFQTWQATGAMRRPPISVNSSAARSSITISAPDFVLRSMVEDGAAITKGILCAWARRAKA